VEVAGPTKPGEEGVGAIVDVGLVGLTEEEWSSTTAIQKKRTEEMTEPTDVSVQTRMTVTENAQASSTELRVVPMISRGWSAGRMTRVEPAGCDDDDPRRENQGGGGG